MSQSEAILAHLQSGKHLTAIEALERFRCFRLAARIQDLRRAGIAISSQIVTLPNGKRVSKYRLASRGQSSS